MEDVLSPAVKTVMLQHARMSSGQQRTVWPRKKVHINFGDRIKQRRVAPVRLVMSTSYWAVTARLAIHARHQGTIGERRPTKFKLCFP